MSTDGPTATTVLGAQLVRMKVTLQREIKRKIIKHMSNTSQWKKVRIQISMVFQSLPGNKVGHLRLTIARISVKCLE